MNDPFERVDRPRGPDFFKDIDKPKKADWKKHEADVEKRTGDRRSRSSGAGHGKTGQTRRRGSVNVGDNMGTKRLRECKATKGRTISVKCDWLDQLITQSLNMGRDPVLEIRMEGATLPTPTDWVMIPADDYEELLERADG
jgi:Holliday junction resolvase